MILLSEKFLEKLTGNSFQVGMDMYKVQKQGRDENKLED